MPTVGEWGSGSAGSRPSPASAVTQVNLCGLRPRPGDDGRRSEGQGFAIVKVVGTDSVPDTESWAMPAAMLRAVWVSGPGWGTNSAER